jgi:hypothetical protein
MEHKINIREYFEKGTFIIPEYQRGYKWPVNESLKESALEFFINSLIKSRHLDEYFIEAVTVVKENGNVIIVDGQQRTTSLILIFAVLKDFELIKEKLVYNVRQDSQTWLNNLIPGTQINIEDEDIQDIFYFKKAINIIKEKLKNIDEENFLQFIKEKVYLLYNPIPKEKAINTFIALNGLKAVMKDEDLIKSELLIKSSRIESRDIPDDKEQQFGIEWKINEDRGRLARNWDKWLYWWNQKDVKEYFGISKTQHPLYYLLVTYWKLNGTQDLNESKGFSFDNFKSKFINNSKNANHHFEKLRKLQKTFEDLYNDWEIYNLLGLSFKSSVDKNEALQFFIRNREDKTRLHKFVKWALIDCEMNEILVENKGRYLEKRAELRSGLEDRDLYISNEKRQAYIQLLRMNVLDMNKRKFDFEVFKTKSLEHICPQNPPDTELNFVNSKNEINEKSDSINSIGNLVLLHGSDNSSLSNNSYDKKKQLLFDKIKEGLLLPHTLKVFSKSFAVTLDDQQTAGLFNEGKFWQSEDVEANKDYFFNEFDKYYGK